MCVVSTSYRDCDVINFVINFKFLVNRVFFKPNSQDKDLNILKTKKALKMKLKRFFIIFEEL